MAVKIAPAVMHSEDERVALAEIVLAFCRALREAERR